jgi:hypothetical protein
VTTVVFVGSTLPARIGRELLPGATFQGPASCGDVYRAWQQGARTIVLIDGNFDQRLAVWHKEILWALSQGVAVIGAASMGALRAAELAAFGMIGHGRIFEWFRAEALEDDDEVAVAHEPVERDYRPSSEAMVNIRVTLAQARKEQIVSPTVAEMLGTIAKRLYYPERTYPELLRRAAPPILSPGDHERLAAWLRVNACDQKRADAVAVLAQLRKGWPPGPATEAFRFEHTEAWDALRARLDAQG